MAVETIGSDPGVDTSVWNSTEGIREGVTLALGHNEFLNCRQIVGAVTSSAQSYEKAADIVQIAHDDPSDYVNGIYRDLTGIEVQTIARKNNTRTWGLSFITRIVAGIRAMISAIEMDGANDGDFVPDPDTPGSSYMMQLIGSKYASNKPLTAAVYIERGEGAGHHRVFVMREDAFASIPTRAFATILYANTSTVKHQMGPDGFIMEGRRVVRKGLPDGAGNWHDFLVLE